MKLQLLLVFLAYTGFGFCQVDFKSSEIIRESYLPSTPPGEYPLLIESKDGGLHLIKAGYTSNVVITDLDKDLKVKEIRNYKLPKGTKVQELFQAQGIPYFVFRQKSGGYEIMKLNIESGTFTSQLSYQLPVSIAADNISEVELLYCQADGIGFHFTRRPGSQMLDSLPTSHVVMFNQELNKIIWETTIKKPKLQSKNKGAKRLRLQEGTIVKSITFQDVNTMVVNSDIGKLIISSSPEGSNYFKYKGNITSLYKAYNGMVQEIWTKRIIGDHIPSNYRTRLFNTDSISETDPIPVINTDGEISIFSLELEPAGGKMKLIQRDASRTIIESIPVLDNITLFMKLASSEIYGRAIPDPSNPTSILFEFQDESFNNPNPQSTILSFRKIGNQIDQLLYQDDTYWKKYGSKLLSYGELSYFENGTKYGSELNTEFARHIDLKISNTDSFSAHFIVNDKVYTLFTAYLIGNMTAQIVQWNFQN